MAKVELIKNIRKITEKAIGSHLLGIDLEYQIMVIRSIKKYYEQNSNIMQDYSDLRNVLEVLDACMDATDTDLSDFDEWDLIEALEKIGDAGDDENIELPAGEVRIIHDDAIDSIFLDEEKEFIKDDLFSGRDIPSYVVIDWDATAENLMIDGYGHHFNHYNGEEYHGGDYYVFRTN